LETDLIRIIRKGSRRLRPLPSGVRTSGTLPRVPKAVLFDVYGTLLQRLPSPRDQRELRTSIRRNGLGMTPDALRRALEAEIAREHGRLKENGVAHPEVRIEDIWRALFPSLGPAELRTVIVQYEIAAHPCWPMPGSRRLIAALLRRGLRLGIVSNAQFYTPLHFAALLGGRPEDIGFSRELCFYSWTGGHAKPSPRMFEEAAAALGSAGVPRNEVLMVGNDPANDIEAGARAGFMTVLVCADRRSAIPESAGTASPANAVIGRLPHLLSVLDAARPRPRRSLR